VVAPFVSKKKKKKSLGGRVYRLSTNNKQVDRIGVNISLGESATEVHHSLLNESLPSFSTVFYV
jgi:hypothetical protein